MLPVALMLAAAAAPFPEPHDNQAVTVPFLSPSEALGRMRAPEGFRVSLFAAEPDVRQPIALCWDHRGRLWIAENYTYADGKERFDLSLRDRIVILEDADHDGRFDRRTVFADDLKMLTSIELGLGGVWAMCPPHLLFIPTEGDRPSGPPRVMLDGFSTTAVSRHTFANGLRWGPDGWLYGRVGISSTSWIDVPGVPQEKRSPTAGGFWRYHPTRKVFEPYCHGTTNPWGHDWNAEHEMLFINTVIGHGWQGIHGAHYRRMHGEDPYPFVYELIDQHADHYHWDTGKKWNDADGGRGGADRFGGGHAHVGMMIYRGESWPESYRDRLFTLNLHGARVNVERVERKGSALVMRHEPDFVRSEDPWFRGIEISQAPDGSAVILDWSDIGECHDQDGIHRGSGRIYKVAYGEPRRPDVDFFAFPPSRLVELQRSRNEWLVRMARWALRERASRGEDLAEALPAWERLAAETDPVLALNAHSTLIALRVRPSSVWDAAHARRYSVESVLAEKNQAVLARLIERELTEPLVMRNQAVTKRAFSTGFIPRAEEREQVVLGLATGRRHGPRVRLALASALPHLSPEYRSLAAQHLLLETEDAADHNLPLLIWTGIRELSDEALVDCAHVSRLPTVTRLIARRLAEKLDVSPGPLDALLEQSAGQGVGQGDVLRGMAEGLRGWRKAAKPDAWEAFARSVDAADAEAQALIRTLNVTFGDGRALDEVRNVALDDKQPVDVRRAALRSLVEAGAPTLRADCEKLIYVNALGLDAIRGLARFDDEAVANRILSRYPNLYPHERPQAVMTLVSRAKFARVLLQAAADGKFPKADLGPAAARQIRAFADPKLDALLRDVWGETRETAADKLAAIRALRAELTPETIAKGDLENGRQLYASVCGQCHKLFGEGGELGPDLTGSGRRHLDYILENVVDPNAVVPASYYLNTFTLSDGRVLSGIVGAETPRTVTLRSVGQEWVLDRADIRKRETAPVSLMPEGLLTALSPEQRRDLVKHLMRE